MPEQPATGKAEAFEHSCCLVPRAPALQELSGVLCEAERRSLGKKFMEIHEWMWRVCLSDSGGSFVNSLKQETARRLLLACASWVRILETRPGTVSIMQSQSPGCA